MLRQLQLAMRKPVCHRTCIKVRLELDSPKLVSCQAEAPFSRGVFRPVARRGTRPPAPHHAARATRVRPLTPRRQSCAGNRRSQRGAPSPHATSRSPVQPTSASGAAEQRYAREALGQKHAQGTCGLVAMTSASHAEGRQFDPGQVYSHLRRRLFLALLIVRRV